MSERREIDLGRGTPDSGIRLIITRKGVELFGWYDHIVGIEGRAIPWDEFDRAREFVQGTTPIGEWRVDQ